MGNPRAHEGKVSCGGGDPSIKVSVLTVALITPPETGASINGCIRVGMKTCIEVEISVICRGIDK